MGDNGAGPGPAELKAPDLDAVLRLAFTARQKGELNRARRELRSASHALAAQEKRPDGVGPSQVAELARELLALDEPDAAKTAADWGRQRFPGDLAVNDAYGEAILRLQGSTFAATAGGSMADYAGAQAATKLNFFLPGLGHWVIDRRKSALIFGIGWISSVVATFLIPDGISGITSTIRGQSGPLNPLVFFTIVLAFALHIGAVADASRLAKGHTPKKPERMAPPVDKDFEL